MLDRSFIFLPSVGLKRERALWARGIDSWEGYRARGPKGIPGVGPALKARHDAVLAAAARALAARDPRFFAHVLPSSEHWRAYGTWDEDALYLDIETTGGLGAGRAFGSSAPSRGSEGLGFGGNDVTVVGLHRRGETRLLVRDRDLTPQAFSEFVEGASLLVTFNGSTFDVPALARAGFAVPTVPHLDLRHALGALGHRGGLKAIERELGLAREDEVEGLSGYDAVVLWHRYQCGDPRALDLLLGYNRADVENMIPLAQYAYAGLSRLRTGEVRPGAPRDVPPLTRFGSSGA